MYSAYCAFVCTFLDCLSVFVFFKKFVRLPWVKLNMTILQQHWEIKKRNVMKNSILSNSLTPPNTVENGNHQIWRFLNKYHLFLCISWEFVINPFQANVSFLYPLRTSEKWRVNFGLKWVNLRLALEI